VAADELQGQNLLLLNIGHCFRDQVLDACREFSRPPAAGKQGNSLETIRNMVATGLGVSVLPKTALTPRYASKLVKAVEFSAPRPSRRVVLAYRRGFPRMAAAKAVRQAIDRLDLPIAPLPS
jgi:LysR family hydrogen peroxide-inducible transcriptional activator